MIQIQKTLISEKKKRINKKKERSYLKQTGKEYITKTGKLVEAKSMKENPCKPETCPNKCHDILEERRKGIFDHYWSLSVERQRDWIVSHTKREKVKRKRTKDNIESRRKFTHSYFINEGEGQRPVCLGFFIKTLDIRQRFLHLVISTAEEGSSNPDKRGEYQEEKEKHLTDKVETYTRFQTHQYLRKNDNGVLCTTFDLQKVLHTPYGESMLLYYSRKIATYNLTFYESVTRNGFCFLWNEVAGKRGANEVCTILAKYIQMVDERESIKHLLLYCDSCPGQNRNKTVLTCIHKCLHKCKNIATIQINYLLPGHTFMPVDSMHSVIEKSVTNTIIWAPSQWLTVCALARKAPRPYEVEVLSHEDFMGWNGTSEKYFKGNLSGKISKIQTVTLKKNHTAHIEVKYSINVETETENIDVIGKTELMPKKIYKSRLLISKKKFNDLEKLSINKTIPAIYILGYKSLPHAASVQDILADTDIEDIED
ncbi:unnamed protein product [Euphydryas editha]|uniref:DUF7869 domain-containing protein n=1 Tax=Euphydryas editha TaxID=104508 RepID=A0AAU9UGQ1_EUPED|nr:unnamed protein product [Euphydryas editha]